MLDTEGDLDVLGRTGRFGHDFETIQGVRFVDDVAYVVTFRQTDPFFVIDLADPAAPRVVGELAIPGFSAYLHPAGDGLVVGFGPDGNGSVSARLFDVTDPAGAAAPVDELRLGNDSTIVWDPHAYVALEEGRVAVPATDWPTVSRCVPSLPDPQPQPEPVPVEPDGGTGSTGSAPSFSEEPPFCEPEFTGGGTGAVVLEVRGGRLVEVDRAMIESDGAVNAERVVLAPDGTWLLLSWDRMVPTDGGAEIVLPADPTASRSTSSRLLTLHAENLAFRRICGKSPRRVLAGHARRSGERCGRCGRHRRRPTTSTTSSGRCGRAPSPLPAASSALGVTPRVWLPRP